MAHKTFLNGKVQLCCGDSIHFLRDQPDNRYDSCVCDPPYALVSIVKRFGGKNATPAKGNEAYMRASAGFMGKQWDTGESAHAVEFWAEVLRVLKPGGHVVAFAGTRTYHRLAVAIEDAGFEIRDMLSWLYGSGFPKSHDVSKAIDRSLGAERKMVKPRSVINHQRGIGNMRPWMLDPDHKTVSDDPISKEAAIWQGWGSALKPACEPLVLARKPISEKTVAANLLRWGTGAININGCRIDTAENLNGGAYASDGGRVAMAGDERTGAALGMFQPGKTAERQFEQPQGRWPANVIHDGSDEVLAAFPDAPRQQYFVGPEHGERPSRGIYGDFGARPPNEPRGDSGSAARFFYEVAKDDIVSEEVVVTWISEQEPHQVTLRVDTGLSLARAIVVSASIASNEWSTFLSGNVLTDLFRQASTCIIRTKTNSTTRSVIWSYLINLLTNESIAGVNCETVNGGSHAESAENEAGSIIITLAKTASLLGVSHAASGTRLRISVSVNSQSSTRSAPRLFYSSKADAEDRLGSRHPTVKPVDLMQWLVRLVTPKGGLVLDPFAGTGTTAEACFREGMRCMLIERETEYQADIRRRMGLVMGGPEERRRESIKAKTKDQPIDAGPLFAATR